jgi:sugar phosphate permease
MRTVINNKFGRPSQYSMFSLIDENDDDAGLSYSSILLDLFSNKVYVFTMLSICCLLFIVTGIQFWISDYMQTVLGIDPKSVFIAFALVSITAPILGVLAGGYLIQQLGGYTKNSALEACFKISILAALSGAFLPLIDFFPLFIILMWLLLFFGASIVPGLTGIMLSSTPEKTKEVANSITHLCYNLLGYLPSPFIYGLVCKYTGGHTSRYGLAFILLWSYFGVAFLFLAKYFKTQIKPKDSPLFESKSNKETKDGSTSESFAYNLHEKKNIEEKAEALTALYGRISSIK